MDDISKGNLNRPELRDESSSSDDDFEQLERLSNQLPSFSEFRAFDSEYDEDEEDEDDDSDEDFGRIGSYFPRRRTFSRCDPPVYPLPEFKVYDDSSVDLAGEVSNLNLYDVTHPPEDAATSKDLTSKRKGTSLIIEEHLSPSAKKIRSSKSDPEVACEKDASSEAEKQSSPIKETKDLQNTLSLPTTATETVSPKRKIEDIENGSKEIHPDKSAVKRTKTKSPTPDNENDSKKGLSEPEEEDNE